MALDGVFLSVISKEIEKIALGARVEKISQPSKDEIIISLRYKNENGAGSKKLLLSANANSPRINFTEIQLENPASPPMFCMLLRKHLSTGRLVAVKQNGLDRILTLEFEAVNELGDLDRVFVIIEIMSRHSNIILVNSAGRVIDSIKRITNEVSSVRMLLPGVTYHLPPSQNKLNILTASDEEIMQAFMSADTDDVAKSIMNALEGISPLLARELAYTALKGQDISKHKLSAFYKERVLAVLSKLRSDMQQGSFNLTVCFDESMKLRDFTVYEVEQYGVKPQKKHYESTSKLLDDFYANRDQQQRMRQRANDLLKLLMSTSERITKKLALQKQELMECANRDMLKVCGDLINANIYQIEKGMGSVELQNFYDENCPTISIKLDKRLAPAQNAQHYYAEYRKAQKAEQMLTELMAKSEQELVYIDSVFDAVTRTKGESELLEIREELAEQGYIKSTKLSKSRMIKAQPPLRYCTSDGYMVMCGRNNKQNDKLTLKTARKNDLWLHTQGIAGSHVIVEAKSIDCNSVDAFSETAITEAALIAAYNSKGRESAQVAVDYTLVRYVKKPNGAKPGMVIFTDYYTAYVTPDEKRVEDLLIK